MNEKLLNLLKSYDSDKTSDFIRKYFNNDYQFFISVLDKINLLKDKEYLELIFSTFPLQYILYQYNKNPNKTIKDISDNYFGDLVKNNDKYLLMLNNFGDLSMFIKVRRYSRNDVDIDTIEKILNGEYESFFDFNYRDIDIINDVVDDLNSDNYKSLMNIIFNELKNTQIEPSTDLLEEIAEKQNHPDYVEITLDLLLNKSTRIDDETLNYLIKISSIDSDLYNLYNTSYQNAYETMLYEEIISEIKGVLSVETIGEWINEKINKSDGTSKTIHKFSVDVTNLVHESIKTVLESDLIDDTYNVFEYEGSFESLIKFLIDQGYMDGAEISFPDYPDYDKVSENINEFFSDYL